MRVMNACGFDAVCFGNHESDVPNGELFKRINELNATWLNSNMRSFTEAFEGRLMKMGKCPDMRLIKLTGGRSVVLIGLNCGGDAYHKLYRENASDPTKSSFMGHAVRITKPDKHASHCRHRR